MTSGRVQEAYARVRERIGFRSVSAAVAAGCPSGVQKSGSHGGNDSYPRFGRCALALIGHMNSAPKWQEIYAPYGQTRSVVLADGSQISSIPGAG